jgi:hypothetical protein
MLQEKEGRRVRDALQELQKLCKEARVSFISPTAQPACLSCFVSRRSYLGGAKIVPRNPWYQASVWRRRADYKRSCLLSCGSETGFSIGFMMLGLV